MEKEKHDYFDDSGTKIGEADYDEIHTKGYLHKTVLIIVFTPEGKIVIHKKPPVEEGVGANKLDIFGGHLKSGESYIDGAIRELEEELGLSNKEEFDFIRIKNEGDMGGKWTDRNLINNELSTLYVYFLKPEEKPRYEERGFKGIFPLEVYEKTLKELSEDFNKDNSQFADGLVRILEKKEIIDYLQVLNEKRYSPEKFMNLCFMTNRDCAEAHRIKTKKRQKLLIFVAMSFDKEYKQDYEAIKAQFEPLYEVKRADDVEESGYIICGKVCAMIQQADFVIAHLTEEWNLNVLYELGLAYALKKKVILLSKDEAGRLFYPSLFNSLSDLKSFPHQFNQMKDDYALLKSSDAIALLYSGTNLKEVLEKTIESLQTQEEEPDFLKSLHYIDMESREKGSPEDILESISKAACVIVEIASDRPESYFWVGIAHGLQKHTLTIMNPERPTKKLPFNLQVLYHLEYDPDPDSIFHTALKAILMRIKENLNDPIERFWLPIIKRGNVKILVGNQSQERPDRVAVGNWDYMAAGELISYLKNRSTSLIVSQPSPISHFKNGEEEKQIINNFKMEWRSVDLIVLGSVDASVGTGIVLEKLFPEGERKVIKERDEKFIEALGSPSCNTFSKEISKIHKACVFSNICQRQDLTNKINKNTDYRGFYGLLIKDSSNREVVLGGCNWFNPNKPKDESYEIVGSCHLIIADNPFCHDNCFCKNGTAGRHKVIIIQGLSGPPTLDITKFLCGKASEEKIGLLEKGIDAIETSGAVLEYFIYTKVRREMKKAIPDEREALGIRKDIFQIIDDQIFRITDELEQKNWTNILFDSEGKGFIPVSYKSQIPVSEEWVSHPERIYISKEEFQRILNQSNQEDLKSLMQPE